MIRLTLSRGLFALIDDSDSWATDYKWYATLPKRGGPYAMREVKLGFGRRNRTTAYLHRMITGAKRGDMVDHVNGDTLDNRRANLRLTDSNGNARNKSKHPTSIMKGVSRAGKKFVAAIMINRKANHIGVFDTPEEAAMAYDLAAMDMFGEFAKTNFGCTLTDKYLENRSNRHYPASPQRVSHH